MSKKESYRFVIFAISIIVVIVYLVAFFAPLFGLPQFWHDWAVGIPVLILVLSVPILVALRILPSEKKVCPNCDSRIVQDSRWCPKCGYKFGLQEEETNVFK